MARSTVENVAHNHRHSECEKELVRVIHPIKPHITYDIRDLRVYFSAAEEVKQLIKIRIASEWASPGLKQCAKHHIDGYPEKFALVVAHEGKNDFRRQQQSNLIGPHIPVLYYPIGKDLQLVKRLLGGTSGVCTSLSGTMVPTFP
jgi:hypothetical protein